MGGCFFTGLVLPVGFLLILAFLPTLAASGLGFAGPALAGLEARVLEAVARASQDPLPLPPPPALDGGQVAARVRDQLAGPAGGRSVRLGTEEVNALVATGIAAAGAVGPLSAVKGTRVDLETGSVRVRAVVSGPDLARTLPDPAAGAPELAQVAPVLGALKRFLAAARFVNVDTRLAPRVEAGSLRFDVSELTLQGRNLLIPGAGSYLEGLASDTAGAAGMGGLRRVEVRPGELEIELSDESSSATGEDPGSGPGDGVRVEDP